MSFPSFICAPFHFVATIDVFRSYKTVTEDDVKMPLVFGEGKKVSLE